ncbi:MAG TPA: hypothetical protein VM097_09885 [Mycobacteriales bacterium]|nr:hypothetical protein [Mycobacteriales bacterium]
MGVTTEAFEPVWDGQSWITGNASTFSVVRIDPQYSRLALTVLAPTTGFSLPNAPSGIRTLVIRMRNVGNDPWTLGQEQLGTASAYPLASGWPSSTRTPPLHLNVTRPGATAVYPGEIGEWVIKVGAFKHSPATYATSLRLVGPGGFYGPSLPLSVKVVAASFTYQYVARSGTVSVPRNGAAWTWVDIKNTSNFVWPVGGSMRSTVLASSSPSRSPSWYTALRPGPLSYNRTHPGLSYVRAGEVARFRILLAGNGRAVQSRSESFGMSYDGWRASTFSVSLAYRIV